jgi:SAM-dependent methyltransferase
MTRMRSFVDHHLVAARGRPLRILDVGGANVNGSYRDVFDDPEWTYHALDVAPGIGVDVVPKTPWRWQDVRARSYDVVVSGSAFEHIAFPWLTIVEIRRVLRPGGLLCLVAPSAGEVHRYPLDCWRYYRDGLVALASWGDLEVVEAVVYDDADRWSDNSAQWADAVLVARRNDVAGLRARVSEIKRDALRAIGSFHARRRENDVQRTADDLEAQSPTIV